MQSIERMSHPCRMKNDFSVELLIHSYNVASVAKNIGENLKLSPKELSMLEEAALYHDIGKSEIPEEILYKPGKLEDEDWHVMKKHAEYSQEIYLQWGRVNLREAAIGKIIRHHHENWDGSGYPDNLKGDQIPYLSRILKIADMFVAMKQKRIYRRWSIPIARQVMEGFVGSELDPKLFYLSYTTLKNLEESIGTEYKVTKG